MNDIETVVAQLQAHGVTFTINEFKSLKWHSIAALKVEQVLWINRHRAAIAQIIRTQSRHDQAA